MTQWTDLILDYHKYNLSSGDGTDCDFSPLYSIDYNLVRGPGEGAKSDKKTLVDWLVETVEGLQRQGGPRVENQFRNLMFYQGIHSLREDTEIRLVDYDNSPVSNKNKFVMNHILELTHQKVARLMRYSPTINVFPWNNSYADRLGARLGKKIIDSAFHIHRFDELLADVALEAAICGESFIFFEWDEFAGDKPLDLKLAEERKKRLGDVKFTNEKGEVVDLKQVPRLGDHALNTPLPFHVLHEQKAKWKDVNYIFKATPKHIDEVRAENAHLGKRVLSYIEQKATNNGTSVEVSDYGPTVIQWEFYHKDHRFVPGGKYAKFFNDVLITHGPLPYEHGGLPCVRFTDHDTPVDAHGRSFYESLKLPSVMINNMTKIAYRSFAIAAYPKIIAQRDSFNMYSMANGPSIIEHDPGSTEPKVVTFNAVNRDFFPLSDHVERFLEKNSGTFGISRGEQPSGARARSILNFYEEQEQERESSQIRKFTAFIEKSAKYLLSNSAQYYKSDEPRTIKIIGKNNRYKLEKMTRETQLAGDYNVKVERTTALSESKEGRINNIVELSNVPLADQDNPGLFTREQVFGMIEVGDTSTFFEMATSSAECAASENEDMFEKLPVNDPQQYQAHLVHWNVHFQWIQSREFSDTTGVPDEVRETTLKHLKQHEFYLYEAAKFNFQLANVLAQNKYFPAVLRLGPGQLPLSQIILMLQQPPMAPAGPLSPEEVGEPALEEGQVGPEPTSQPQPDVAPPEPLPEGNATPTDPIPQGDQLPVA